MRFQRSEEHAPAAVNSDGSAETVMVEAPSLEAALSAVTQQFGTDCEIEAATKMRRGGVAGMFSKEVYRVTIRPRSEGGHGQQPQAEHPGEAVSEAVDRVLANVGAAASGDGTFGDALRARVAEGQADFGPMPDRRAPREAPSRAAEGTSTLEAEPFDGVDLAGLERADELARARRQPIDGDERAKATTGLSILREAARSGRTTGQPGPTSVPESADGSAGAALQRTGAPIFTSDNLVRAGLPFGLVVRMGDLGPLDEAQRLLVLAEALGPWCDPQLGDGELLIGPEARRLGDQLGLNSYEVGDVIPFEGPVCIECRPTDPEVAAYIESVRAGRVIHYIGDDAAEWNEIPHGSILSWSTHEGAQSHLYLALERGMFLGFDVSSPAPRRATALEVALSIRARLPVSKL